MNKINFNGTFVIIGFGSIGSGIIPLIYKHFANPKIKIITKDARNLNVVEWFNKEKTNADYVGLKCEYNDDYNQKHNIEHKIREITKNNYLSVLAKEVKSNDFLVNLSVDVGSVDLIKYCLQNEIFYIDTCIEPWAGRYRDEALSLLERSNFTLRQEVLKVSESVDVGSKTVVVAHGANPGLVSHFVKSALRKLAKLNECDLPDDLDHVDWAILAQELNIEVCQISEHDSQVSGYEKGVDEFVNTWSVEGFISEGAFQPSEMSFGTHEKELPAGGSFHDSSESSVFMDKPGVRVKVKTWTPTLGACEGFMVTHNETFSISQYLSTPDYRMTSYYAYRPSKDAISSFSEFFSQGMQKHPKERILSDEIVSGVDELGVMLFGNSHGSYWFGSILDIDDVKKIVPFNSATSLQVCAGVLAGIIWAIENPDEGIVESEQMDHKRVMEIARPYLGKVVGVLTDWTPLSNRQKLFKEDLDHKSVNQFKNFRAM